MANILLGDDDEELIQLLQEYLHNHGIQGDCVHDGEAVIERLKSAMHDSAPYDLLVLDIMMPKIDGLSVLRQLPAISDIPVIMLTAKGEEIDRIIGLELGADDYITKPCNPRELLARIRAVMRRNQATAQASGTVDDDIPLVCGDIAMQVGQHQVTVRGETVFFPLKEFELLEYLMQNKGRVMTRHQLIDRIWGSDYVGDTKTLDVHVKRVRSKIEEDPAHPKYLTTVRGLGYKIDTPAE